MSATDAASGPLPRANIQQRRLRQRFPAPKYVYLVDEDEDLSTGVRRFVDLTNDPSVGAAFDLESPSTTLLVAFGGMPGHMGMAPFEFFTISSDLGVKKAYLRDLEHAWYHAGVRAFGDDVEAVAEKLRSVVSVVAPRRVVFAGNSAGGWAALLFGALVGANLVLAFSPQTLLVASELAAAGDDRWDALIEQSGDARLWDERYVDLRPILAAHPPPPGGAREIHYDASFDLDAFHAERLADLPGVTVHGHPRGRHGLIRYLRATGALAEILRDAVAETGTPGSRPGAA